MRINYRENASDLEKRIDIHNQFGGYDIDKWMLKILDMQPNLKILDVGCGAGKQCFSYYRHLNGAADITGGDVSEELLNKAKTENEKINNPIKFIPLNFNERFPFEEEEFDLVSCCFAIYYAKDIPFTIDEIYRILKPGGRFFSTGPMPDNKRLFYDIILKATHKPIPPMPGSSRYSSELLYMIKSKFTEVRVEIFNNPLTFKTITPFIEYTRASLSEDRQLWKDLFAEIDFEQVMANITEVAQSHLEKDGQLVMTKVVGGFLATK